MAPAAGVPTSPVVTSSKRPRPCDTCRQRKTRCVRDKSRDSCVLCIFHKQPCTFLRGPPPRPRPRKQPRHDETAGISSGDQSINQVSPSRSSESNSGASLDSTSQDQTAQAFVEEAAHHSYSPTPAPAILNNTLGLDPATHAEYVGPSDYRDPVLLDLHRPLAHYHAPTDPNEATLYARRLDSNTVFLIHPDESAASEAQRIADLDTIEATVKPLGKTLVELYFRVVHPSFPILHKDVFISKHQVSHRQFAPSLLAAVYLIALDWQLYDSVLAGRGSLSTANATILEELAERCITQDMQRPKLSTLEAGLLLLQRGQLTKESGNKKKITSSRMFTAQLVTMAQDLGIHVDCSSWSVPAWEGGLRRRLAWALYMQDRWGAFVHGRPFLIHDDDWDVQPCNDEDFPELAEKQNTVSDGRENARLGWHLFMHHVELAHMLSQVIKTFYVAPSAQSGSKLDQMGPVAVAELAKPLVLKLREWHASLPEELKLEKPQVGKLCANGSLHLAYAAIELSIHRVLVRVITPQTPAPLREAIRTTARARLQESVHFLASLQPEHTAAFWSSAASHQAAHIGSLAALLWATAETPEEMDWCASQVNELRWALRVRGNAALFAREALRLIERRIGGLGIVQE